MDTPVEQEPSHPLLWVERDSDRFLPPLDLQDKESEVPVKFVPPSGKLAAVTRKGNDIKQLLNEGCVDKKLITDLHREYIEKVTVLNKNLEEQILVGEERKKKLEWADKLAEINYITVTVNKYLEELNTSKGALPKKFDTKTIRSKASSTSSAKVKLAELKAQLTAQKEYNIKVAELEDTRVKLKREQEAREAELKKKMRKAEEERIETEGRILEQELEKLDVSIENIDHFDDKSKYSVKVESQRNFEEVGSAIDLQAKFGNNFHNYVKSLENQSELTKYLISIQDKNALPRKKIDIFSGERITEYKEFIRNFSELMNRGKVIDGDQYGYLLQFTTGKAKEIVRSCCQDNSYMSFKDAIEALDEEYGNDYKVAGEYLERLDNWPEIKSEDSEAFSELSLFLTSCNNHLNHSTIVQLNHPKEIRNIVMKLPYRLREKWREFALGVSENGSQIYFDDLVKFVKKQAKLINQPIFGFIKDSRDNIKSKNRSFNVKLLDENNDRGDNRRDCLYCKKSNHTITYCIFFDKLSYDKKHEFIMKNYLCFSCLAEGHMSKNCDNKLQCRHCPLVHPSILHREIDYKKDSRSEDNPSSEVNLSVKNKCRGVMCSVIPVRIKVSGKDNYLEVYASLDTCSSSCFIDERILKSLDVQGKRTKIELTTMTDRNSVVSTKIINNLEVYDMNNKLIDVIPVVYSRPNWPFTRADTPKLEDIENSHLSNLPYSFIDADISVLIGMNRPSILKPLKIADTPNSLLYATFHSAGWALNGSVARGETSIVNNKVNVENEKELEQTIIDIFDNDFKDSQSSLKEMSKDELKWHTIVENSIRKRQDGHYEIDLPIKENLPLNDNRCRVLHAFRSLLSKFDKDDNLFKDYCEFIKMMLENGFMEKVPREELHKPSWYLTHHAVYHKQKQKIRVVYNCSLKHKGVSLNDILYQGPDLTNNLVGVLLRFRENSTAFTGDIAKMFYQVKVSPKCRDYLRFFWIDEVTGKPVEYRLNVHVFGATSSPAIANFALRQVVYDRSNMSESCKMAILKNFYVDDLLCSVKNESDGFKLLTEITSSLADAGFNLTKFVTNSSELDEMLLKEGIEVDNSIVKSAQVLGLTWKIKEDVLKFKAVVCTKSITRRNILSVIHSVYDPLGICGPVLVAAKQIFQETCKLKLDWDSNLPVDLAKRWNKWLLELPDLGQFELPRCYVKDTPVRTELHFFCDGSDIAYGAIAYLRSETEKGNVNCTAIMAKTRLTPISISNHQTIPRIELN